MCYTWHQHVEVAVEPQPTTAMRRRRSSGHLKFATSSKRIEVAGITVLFENLGYSVPSKQSQQQEQKQSTQHKGTSGMAQHTSTAPSSSSSADVMSRRQRCCCARLRAPAAQVSLIKVCSVPRRGQD